MSCCSCSAYQSAYGSSGGGSATPGGSSGQVQYNNGGAFGGVTGITLTAGTLSGFSTAIDDTTAGAASTPAMKFTGAVYAAGSATTNKALVLIEPTGTTSTGWSTSGTGLGINLPTGFAGRAIDVQKNGATMLSINNDGAFTTIGTVVANGGGLYMRNGAADLFNVQSSNTSLCVAPTYKMGWSSASAFGMTPDAFFMRAGAAASIQMGLDHATTATNQTFKAHNVTTGTGADLILAGGTGSVANGNVRFGTHRAIGEETVTGFITIKDEGGTTRKVAIVS